MVRRLRRGRDLDQDGVPPPVGCHVSLGGPNPEGTIDLAVVPSAFGRAEGAEDERRAGELRRRQPLVEDEPAGGRGDDRAQEPEERHLPDGQPVDAAEPQAVGDARADGRQPEVAEQRSLRTTPAAEPSTARASGSSTSPPATSCQVVNVRKGTGLPQCLVSTTPVAIDAAPANPANTPAPSSWAPARRTSSATPSTPSAPATTTLNRIRSRSRMRREPGGDERLDGAERGGDAARQSVGGEEQQREEPADVERAEHDGLRPPRSDRPLSCHGGEHEPGGQRPQHAGEQRAVRAAATRWSRGRSCPTPRGRGR